MSTVVTDKPSGPAPDVSERVEDVEVTNETIAFRLTDGRVIRVPLAWSWRLQEATPAERQNYEISPSGYGVRWPEIDEDLSARGLLRGTPARRSSAAPPAERPSDWTPGRIKRLREALGMAQSELADRMGVRQATVSDWETGKQTPSPMARRLLDRIAGATE